MVSFLNISGVYLTAQIYFHTKTILSSRYIFIISQLIKVKIKLPIKSYKNCSVPNKY